MEDCWAKEPNQRPLLGFVYSRLEAIFLSHCHGRIVDTGMYLTLNAKNLTAYLIYFAKNVIFCLKFNVF